MAKATEIADDKDVGVNGGEIARQCFDAGLLDEVHVDLVRYSSARASRCSA